MAEKILLPEAQTWSADAVPCYAQIWPGTDPNDPDNAQEGGAVAPNADNYIQIYYSSAVKPGKCYNLFMSYKQGVLTYQTPPSPLAGEIDCSSFGCGQWTLKNWTVDSDAVAAKALALKQAGENISSIQVQAAAFVRQNRACPALSALADDAPVYVIDSTKPYSFGSMVLKFPVGPMTETDAARYIIYDASNGSLVGIFPFTKKMGTSYGPYECAK